MRADLFCPKNGQYCKSSIRPLGGLFISGPFETGGLFNLKTTMVSVFHKELEYKVNTLKNKKF